jgi:hypothetical protein
MRFMGSLLKGKDPGTMGLNRQTRTLAYRLLALILGIIGAFFIFYTIRLLVITHGLTVIQSGGQGTYIGAVAFPLLALGFGFGAWRLLKAARK